MPEMNTPSRPPEWKPRKKGEAFIPGVHEVPEPEPVEDIDDEPTLNTSIPPGVIRSRKPAYIPGMNDEATFGRMNTENAAETVEMKDSETLHKQSKNRLLGENIDVVMQILSVEMNRSLEEIRKKPAEKLVQKLIGISREKGSRFDIDANKGVFIENGKVFAAGLELTMETPGKFNETAFIGSSGNREILVINDKEAEYSDLYEKAYSDLLAKISEAVKKSESKPRILPIIYRQVQGALGGEVEDLDVIISEMSEGQNDPEPDINLGEFMKRKKGFCRHKAALAGYLLERLSKDYGPGKVYDKLELKRSRQGSNAHAWLEVVEDGQPVVFDTEKRVVGIDKETASREKNWQY